MSYEDMNTDDRNKISKTLMIAGYPYYWMILSDFLKRESNNTCELCGKASSCLVHHIDINPTNNNSNNLIVLCPRCHGFRETHHSNFRDRNDFLAIMISLLPTLSKRPIYRKKNSAAEKIYFQKGIDIRL